MSINDLPAIDASLNGLSAVLLTAGFIFIRQKNIPAHLLSLPRVPYSANLCAFLGALCVKAFRFCR